MKILISQSSAQTNAKTAPIAKMKRQSSSPSLGILTLLFLCSVLENVNAATNQVSFDLGIFTSGNVAYKQVRIVPSKSSFPRAEGNQVVGIDYGYVTTDAAGKFTNYFVTGTFDIEFTNRFTLSRFQITTPATNAGRILTAAELTTTGTNLPSNLAAYSQAAADARFVRSILGAGGTTVTSNSGVYTVSNSASSGGGSLALSTNNTFLGSTGIVRLEFTNSATINTGVSYSNAGIAYLSFDLNPQATNAIGTNLLSWLNSNSNRTWVADDHFTNWTAAVSNLAQTKAVTNNPTTGGNFNHYGDMFVDGELEGNAVTVSQGALSLQYGTTDRVLGLFPNTMVSNTAVTISMLEGFSPADIWATNRLTDLQNVTNVFNTTKLNKTNDTARQLTVAGSTGATTPHFAVTSTNGGSTNLLVATNGNVGIGTNAPGVALEIQGSEWLSGGLTNIGGASLGNGRLTVTPAGNVAAGGMLTSGGIIQSGNNIIISSAGLLSWNTGNTPNLAAQAAGILAQMNGNVPQTNRIHARNNQSFGASLPSANSQWLEVAADDALGVFAVRSMSSSDTNMRPLVITFGTNLLNGIRIATNGLLTFPNRASSPPTAAEIGANQCQTWCSNGVMWTSCTTDGSTFSRNNPNW